MAESRWRPVHVRLWRHPGFRALAPNAQRLVFYLLTGPQSNRLGLFFFSLSTAAEDLDATPETIRKGLADVSGTFGWTYDATARVMFIPSWWRWNVPQNPKHLTGCLKDLAEVPPCGLVEAFTRNLDTLPDTLHQTFVEGCRIRLPRGSGNQNLNLNLIQEQEQETRASRGAEKGQFGRDARFELLEPIVEVALSQTAQRDTEHLADVVSDLLRRSPETKEMLGDVRRAEIVQTISTVTSNRETARSSVTSPVTPSPSPTAGGTTQPPKGGASEAGRPTNGGMNPRRWQPRPALRDDLPLLLSLFDVAPPLGDIDR